MSIACSRRRLQATAKSPAEVEVFTLRGRALLLRYGKKDTFSFHLNIYLKKGITKSPAEFLNGVRKGSSSLLSNSAYGFMNAASKVCVSRRSSLGLLHHHHYYKYYRCVCKWCFLVISVAKKFLDKTQRFGGVTLVIIL